MASGHCTFCVVPGDHVRAGPLDAGIVKLDLISLFIDLDDDEVDKTGSKGNYEDIDMIDELDLPEIAVDTGTETVMDDYDGNDPGLEKMDRNAPTEMW